MDGWSVFWSVLFYWILFLFAIWIIYKSIKFFIIRNTKSPLDIAKERYARGEISKEELNEIKKNLE